jgi:hypothetical protein
MIVDRLSHLGHSETGSTLSPEGKLALPDDGAVAPGPGPALYDGRVRGGFRMLHRCRFAAGGLAVAAVLAGPALAQPTFPEGSALVRALADCRKLTDDAARLACYDAAAGRLESAERAGEVVVVDRAQARAARRQAFGFNLPSLNIFDRSEPEVEEVTLTIARASRDGNGRWVLRTEDGQLWRQIDNKDLVPGPRAGSKAEVRRATLGSYFMNVDKERAIRVRREQ